MRNRLKGLQTCRLPVGLVQKRLGLFAGRPVRHFCAVDHRGAGCFAGLDTPLEAGRYHSLAVARESLPEALEITATAPDGLVMGLRHRQYPVEGIQFHPESILTPEGMSLLANWLRSVRDRRDRGH